MEIMRFSDKYLLFFIVLAILSSCVNSIDDEDDSDSIEESCLIELSPVIFNGDGRSTKTTFSDKDEIGLFIMNRPNKISEKRHCDNMRFTFSKNAFEPDTQVFFSEDILTSDFIAYYPYNTEGVKSGKSAMEVHINADQTTSSAYQSSDFLTVKVENISPSSEPVNLIFKHIFSKINFRIKPEGQLTIDDLLTSNPQITITGAFVKGEYDFETDRIGKLNTASSIIPHGNWAVKNGLLVGKSAIMIPQNFDTRVVRLELVINGREYSGEFSGDWSLERGNEESLDISLSLSESVLSCSLNTGIEDWNTLVEGKDIDVQEASTVIALSSLNFLHSEVYRVVNNNKDVAEICREYLMNDADEFRAIVIYPINNGETDLTNGMILHVFGENNSEKIGGSIKWNPSSNTFEYTNGAIDEVEKIYISATKGVVLNRPSDALQLQLRPRQLDDTRGNETLEYGIVKIGTQYWMGANLKATKYADGSDINGIADFSNQEAGFFRNQYYYFYNSQAISSGMLAPTGWRISTVSDWEKLRTYLNNKASLLKGGSSWNGSSLDYPHTNLAGFNAVAVGFYNPTYRSVNENVCYWTTENANPNAAAIPFILSYNSNWIRQGTFSAEMGASIRCVME